VPLSGVVVGADGIGEARLELVGLRAQFVVAQRTELRLEVVNLRDDLGVLLNFFLIGVARNGFDDVAKHIVPALPSCRGRIIAWEIAAESASVGQLYVDNRGGDINWRRSNVPIKGTTAWLLTSMVDWPYPTVPLDFR
jgi:hypothetical protein